MTTIPAARAAAPPNAALRIGLLPALVVLTAVLFVFSLAVGPAALSPADVIAALVGKASETTRAIVTEIRLPRAILSLLVGAMLGTAGAALQGFLRNPLAEPSVLGASNGAALGAVIALYFGLAKVFPAALPLAAIAGALLALGVLLGLTRRTESALGLVLAGVAVGTLAGAGTSLALNLSPNPYAAMEITFWLMGSLEDRAFSHVMLALPAIAVGLALLLWNPRALDALTLGEDGARALGVNLARTRLRMVLGVAIGVGGAVAVSGTIGFIGLIVPHMVRSFTDGRPSSTLLPSTLAGAALLTAADIGVRLLPSQNELRLGVVTAFLGVPFFLFFLFRARRVW